MMGEYVVGDALEALDDQPTESAALIHLDDAWARPKRYSDFGVNYPTHGFETTVEILDACHRVLEPGGWLIADADDWLLPRLTQHLMDHWGDVAATYEGGGYRKTGRVTLVSNDGTPDCSTPGQYLSTGGYPVVFAHKGETDRRTPASASQIAPRQRERFGWQSVKPLKPYYRWVEALTESGERVVSPCAGTAPAAVAAERLGREWLAVDCESDAERAFSRRLREESWGVVDD